MVRTAAKEYSTSSIGGPRLAILTGAALLSMMQLQGGFPVGGAYPFPRPA